MYKVEYHPAVKKDLKKIGPQIRKKIRYEYIPIILLNPDAGEKKERIFIQMIAKRGDFYSYLKRRI